VIKHEPHRSVGGEVINTVQDSYYVVRYESGEVETITALELQQMVADKGFVISAASVAAVAAPPPPPAPAPAPRPAVPRKLVGPGVAEFMAI
jgi:hypothetical protein